MGRERRLARLPRAAGTFEIPAFFAVVMPRSWMEASHAWLGLGAASSGPQKSAPGGTACDIRAPLFHFTGEVPSCPLTFPPGPRLFSSSRSPR